MAVFKTTKRGSPSVELAGPIRRDPSDDAEALDGGAFLKPVEADLGDDEDSRAVRGIVKGVAVGTVLWILLMALVVLAF